MYVCVKVDLTITECQRQTPEVTEKLAWKQKL